MSTNPDKDTTRSEYDFSAGVRGRHHQQFQAGANVMFLDADVATVFKDSESAKPCGFSVRPFMSISTLARDQID
jgi:hypothetical protein